MRRQVLLLLPIAFIVAGFRMTTQAFAAGSQQVVQPRRVKILRLQYLSLDVYNPVMISVDSRCSGTARLRLDAAREDGAVVARMASRMVTLKRGRNYLRESLAPELLKPFAPGDTIVLRVDLNGVRHEADFTALHSAVPPQPSDWNLFLHGTVVLNTKSDTRHGLAARSLKDKAVEVEIRLEFMDPQGKNIVKATPVRVSVSPGVGATPVDYTVSAATAVLAKSKGDTQCKGIMVAGGVVRGSVVVPLDFDLTASASATPVGGGPPFKVAFRGNASGGAPPYIYMWDFLDGHGSHKRNPIHMYAANATYDVTLRVVDSLGGWADSRISVTTTAPSIGNPKGRETAP